MVNTRLNRGEYVETVAFTLSRKHVKMLAKIAKNYKNRSEALRALIELEAQRLTK